MSKLSDTIKNTLSVVKTQIKSKQDAIATKEVFTIGATATISNDLTILPASTVSSNSNTINLNSVATSLGNGQARVLTIVVTSTLTSDITPTFRNAGTQVVLADNLVITAGKTTVFTIIVHKAGSQIVNTYIAKVTQP